MNNKKQLRQKVKEIKKSFDIESLSKKLTEKLIKSKEYQQSHNIMTYYPIKGEIDLTDIFKDGSKNFYLPKINGADLLCCPYSKGDNLCISCFHTFEPLTNSCSKSAIDLIIVPALAVDKNNYRLGYGGGFYDRFLADYSGTTLTCVPKALIVDSIYPESFDIPIDIVISE